MPVDAEIVALVGRAKEGDRAAFAEIFQRFHRRVYSTVYQVVQNENDADDITQDVFVKVHQSLGTLDADEAFTTWLFTMTVNLCRDHLRRRKRSRARSLDEPIAREDGEVTTLEIPDAAPGPGETAERGEMHRLLHRAIAELPEHQRSCVILHHLQDIEVTEIAKIVGCRVGTVKSRLSRARDALKAHLEPYLFGESGPNVEQIPGQSGDKHGT